MDQWLQLLTVVGANLAMFMWSRSEARHDQQEIREIIRAIQEEMKDFHTKLALQDQEFKSRLCEIEEKNKGK